MKKSLDLAAETQLIDPSRIPDQLYGVPLSQEDKNKLSKGELTSVLQNLQLQDGTVKDARVRLREVNGVLKVDFHFRKENLQLPDKVFNHQLTEQQKEDLAQDKTVGPLKQHGKEFFLQVDPEINKIVVKTSKEIGIPKTIGHYRLTGEDKKLLANGATIPARLYKGPEGYFVANVSLTPDKKGLEFTNVKTADPSRIRELKTQLNQSQSNSIDPDEIQSAIDRKDWKKLDTMVKSGASADDKLLNFIKDHRGLSKEDKTAAYVVLDKNPDQFLRENKKKPGEKALNKELKLSKTLNKGLGKGL